VVGAQAKILAVWNEMMVGISVGCESERHKTGTKRSRTRKSGH
jgi:hypothetical protein